MTVEYTGRTRYRQATIHRIFSPDETVLIFQVEKKYKSDYYHQCYPDFYTRWEDARIEDLTLMEPVEDES
jgi:hypothetical protein